MDQSTPDGKGYDAQFVSDPKRWDTAAKNVKAQPDGKPGILRFGGGLMLWAAKSGTKTWYAKVQRNGKQTTLTLGHYPMMSVKQAQAARLALRTAEDPGQERRQAKADAALAQTQTLRAISEAWLQARAENQHWTEKHRREVTRRLELHVLDPKLKLADRPIAGITTVELEKLIRGMDRGANGKLSVTAHRVADHLRLIYDYAERRVKELEDRRNPIERIAQDLPGVVPTVHHAAAKTVEDARAVLRAVEARVETLAPLGVLAHRFIALTAVRKEEALDARWSEIDFETATWTVPAKRMKVKGEGRGDFPVPLSRQAVELLRVARQLSPGELVFADASGRVGGRTLNNLMEIGQEKAGINLGMVPHSWRSTFTTLMNKGSHEVLEAVLAHAVPGVRGAYQQGWFLEERRPLMQAWADRLLPETEPGAAELVGLEPATNVVALRREA
jgi:integrase